MKKIVSLVLALMMLLSLVSVAAADEKVKETVIIATNEDETQLDPQQSNGTTHLIIRWMTHSTLVDLNTETGAFEPDLATEWEQVSDTLWVFHLAENATFQDGTPVKASDVAFTIERAHESSFTSDKVEWIKEVRAVDDHTVEIELTAGVQDILYYLAYSTLSILSEKAVTADPENGVNIGSGPYVLSNWSVGDQMVFDRYEGYWGEMPKTKQFIIRVIPEASSRLIALQAGEIDICLDPAAIELSHIEEDDNLILWSKASEKTQYVTMNTTKAPFDNQKVRQAVAYAINPEDIMAVAVEGRGTITKTFFSPGVGCYADIEGYSYDPEKAAALLAEAGYADGLNITISVNVAEEEKVLQAQVMQEELALIGINAEIETLDLATLKTKFKEADYEMSIYNWANDSSGPDNNVRPLLRSGSGSNRSHFADAYIDDLMDKALIELDAEKRVEMYHEIQSYVLDQAPILPLYYNNLYVGTVKDVQNFVLDPSYTHRFSYVYVTEE